MHLSIVSIKHVYNAWDELRTQLSKARANSLGEAYRD